MKNKMLVGQNTYAETGGWFEPAKWWVKTTRKMTASASANNSTYSTKIRTHKPTIARVVPMKIDLGVAFHLRTLLRKAKLSYKRASL